MTDRARAELAQASARLGANTLLVQAAGGNTSIKCDDTLWIKASGQWLADAAARDIMVPVALSALCHAHASGENVENANRFLRQPGALRPSIETAMHALLPDRVVLHVHCVATIAAAVRRDAADYLAGRLAGLNYVFLPYVRPGQPLADAVAANPGHEIYVLGNHGLVAGASSVAAAEAALEAVRRRLAVAPRAATAADRARLDSIAAGSGYEPAPETIATLGTDSASLAAARSGSLYPDHVIFLGPGVSETTAHGAPLVVVPGAGALLRLDASPSARAMAQCLADVAGRIPAGTALNTLTKADETALLGWEAEAYRKDTVRPAGDDYSVGAPG
jgi:rhamnose utilization protein RhaD (predicted bifunctional aldolase and dehydrogenase)